MMDNRLGYEREIINLNNRITELEQALAEAREALKPYIKVPPISPPYWKVGMKVRFRESREWAWSKGKLGVVNARRKEYIKKPGNEYQVFYTHPLSQDGTVDTGCSWWTTPDDVDWVDEPLIDLRALNTHPDTMNAKAPGN